MDADIARASVIVVGVDGSESSVDALRWAGAHAKVTGARLEVVMAWRWPTSWGRTPTWPPGQDPQGETRKLLAGTVESALGAPGALHVRQVVVEGDAAPALIAASEHADLLVVGSRGHGAFAGTLLGSVSRHCVTHAACPVVIVRHGGPEAQ
jgi:nucleotide-binding universal stress UspA family protein